MPKYSYIAKTRDAKKIRDVEEAVSQDDLISKLRTRGLFIIAIKKVGEKKEHTARSLFKIKRGKRGSVKLDDLIIFCRNFATTLSSGITLVRSLDLLAAQTESGKLETILKDVSEEIKGGLSLSEAIARYPRVFSTVWVAIIKIGEASGNLPLVLDRLADYLDLRSDFERKLKSALVYPVILLFVGLTAVFVFFKFIMPRFSEIFAQLGVELPAITQIVLALGAFLEKYLLYIVIGVIPIIVLLSYFKKTSKGKVLFDKLSLNMPIMGRFIFLSCVERFASLMSILLESGVPLVFTLEHAALGSGNSIIERRLLSVKDRVKEGSSLSSEFDKVQLFPLLIVEMTKVGEETGTMPEVFKKLAGHYRRELTVRIERMIVAVEPLMIFFMGGFIGTIVIALFLPLFKMATISG